MKTNVKLFTIILASALTVTSCAKKNYASNTVMVADSAVASSPRALKMASMKSVSNDMAFTEGAFEAEEAAPANNNNSGKVTEKKLVKTGNLTVEVTDLNDSISLVEQWAEKLGGYVSNSSSSERNAWFTVKVPCARFDEAMNSLGNVGKVLNHGVNTDDVTEQFYDLESRIQNKKVMKDKLEGYLKAAKDIKDLLQIERELNSVISEIDSMEGRLKRLSNQIDYSTISINLVLPSNHDDSGFILPDLGNGFSDFISNFLFFLAGFLKVFLLVLLCGIPVLAAVAFLFWLLFGRVGLIFKLYNWLKKQK